MFIFYLNALMTTAKLEKSNHVWAVTSRRMREAWCLLSRRDFMYLWTYIQLSPG